MFVTINTEETGRDHIIVPPNSFALAETVEEIRVPRDVLAICLGKSTYARCGIIVNVTPLEPEWCGKVTLEISNTTPLPAAGVLIAHAWSGRDEFVVIRKKSFKIY